VFCLQELDTQNFESFDEDDAFAKKQKQNVAASRKDLDFIGYTYKNFEVVGEEVQKKKGKAKPSLASIFPGMPAMTPEREKPGAGTESESATPYHTAQFHGLAEEGETEMAAAVAGMSVAEP